MTFSALRPPAVAGAFYPGDRVRLAESLSRCLAAGGQPGAAPRPCALPPKALVVPHAGYIYSGFTAGRAYALLKAFRATVRRVILLGPTHRVAVAGLAAPTAQAFATPLGAVPVDREAIAALADLPQVVVDDAVHAPEHSLEVQLPFLQTVLEDFRIVPLAVGHCAPNAVAQVLDRLWGGPETLIVLSTDLSHYLPQREAQRLDEATCRKILALEADIDPHEACGAQPLNGLLVAARRHALEIELLQRCTSGDTSGDLSRVVGYAAFAFMVAEGTEGHA